jgi:hypothetical protein
MRAPRRAIGRGIGAIVAAFSVILFAASPASAAYRCDVRFRINQPGNTAILTVSGLDAFELFVVTVTPTLSCPVTPTVPPPRAANGSGVGVVTISLPPFPAVCIFTVVGTTTELEPDTNCGPAVIGAAPLSATEGVAGVVITPAGIDQGIGGQNIANKVSNVTPVVKAGVTARDLPRTGMEIAGMVTLGLILLAVGVVLSAGSRHRRVALERAMSSGVLPPPSGESVNWPPPSS